MSLQKAISRTLVFSLVLFLFSFISLVSTTYAASDSNIESFSVEGNPTKDYYFDQIFPLFRYIRAPSMKILESQNPSRHYEDVHICGDQRDYVCSNNGDGCDGGAVDLCNKDGSPAYTTHSNSNDSCNAPDSPLGAKGKCSYKQNPSISYNITSTDFSADSVSSPLPNPKAQNESSRYSRISPVSNIITNGSHVLLMNSCDQILNQYLVVYRAKQTKNTVLRTKEWPLGWVDWGYKVTYSYDDDSNASTAMVSRTKTLLQIHDELPDTISGFGVGIAEAVDDFYLNAGAVVSDYSAEKKIICDAVNAALSIKPLPVENLWALDLTHAPLYSPSLRKGYERVSICVWAKCCPGAHCPYLESVLMNLFSLLIPTRALHNDISVSQAFGAAIDDLRTHMDSRGGFKEMKLLFEGNPLIRFATSASENAIPSKITLRLDAELKGTCLDYAPGFTWFDFGTYIDYVNPGDFLDPAHNCPAHNIIFGKIKEEGGAVPTTLLSSILGLVYSQLAGPVDEVSAVKIHLITIPDAMGQYIDEIETPIGNTIDNAAVLVDKIRYASTIVNVVAATGSFLPGGKGFPVSMAKRFLEFYSCSSTADYSQSAPTSIKDYALAGLRIGCQETQASTAQSSCSDTATPTDVAAAARKASAATGIPANWLVAISTVEGGTTQLGANCVKNPNSPALGPMQITDSAYTITTCDKERIGLDSTACSHDLGQLSRCNLEDSMLLAARLLLLKLGELPNACSVQPAANISLSRLYTATNNYYGICTPDALTSAWNVPGVTRTPNYGDVVCNLAGQTSECNALPQCP